LECVAEVNKRNGPQRAAQIVFLSGASNPEFPVLIQQDFSAGTDIRFLAGPVNDDLAMTRRHSELPAKC
jgi:hypothetical protein